jgi:hypothetical protein
MSHKAEESSSPHIPTESATPSRAEMSFTINVKYRCGDIKTARVNKKPPEGGPWESDIDCPDCKPNIQHPAVLTEEKTKSCWHTIGYCSDCVPEKEY